MPIESKITGGIKSLAVQSVKPDMAQSNSESFDCLMAAILNLLQGNTSILSISTFQSGDQDISAEGSSLPETAGQPTAGKGKDAGSCTAEIGIKQGNIFPNFDNAADSNDVKFDEVVKSRKNPSPSMGEGWGEGALPFIPSHKGRGDWTFYESIKFVQPIKESPESTYIPENAFIITKKDNASIDVFLGTKSLGKLHIELAPDKGMINAQIKAPEAMGKDSIVNNLHNTLYTLGSEIDIPNNFSIIKDFQTLKSPVSEVLFELDKFTALEQPAAGKGKDAGSHTAEIDIKPGNIFPNFDNTANSNNVKFAQPIKESPESTYIPGNAFIITKKDDASIDVFLGTKSLGKLHIELTLDKGMINAHINVSDTIGKELIVNNLHNILNTLNNEGLNVGSFSVSLKDKRNEAEDNVGEEDSEAPHSRKEIQLPISYWDMKGVSIFV